MPDNSQIFTILFLMLGPFKIIGPFVKVTKNADPTLTRKLAVRAIIYSVLSLLLAAFLGESILEKYGIPIPILSLAAGIIFFLVALLNILNQFNPLVTHEEATAPLSLSAAMNPLAFPTIVTPHGIAAVIIFITLSPDLKSKLTVGAIVAGIMVLNLLILLFAKAIIKPLATILALLGSILGIIQVALGAKIIYTSLTSLLAS